MAKEPAHSREGAMAKEPAHSQEGANHAIPKRRRGNCAFRSGLDGVHSTFDLNGVRMYFRPERKAQSLTRCMEELLLSIEALYRIELLRP